MLKNLLVGLLVYMLITAFEDIFKSEDGPDGAAVQRSRIFKFALYQDLLVALSILKMMVFEGYTIYGVMERIRSSGMVTHVYLATSLVLHGTLLFDENTDHMLRLNPSPYVPPSLDDVQRQLFLV